MTIPVLNAAVHAGWVLIAAITVFVGICVLTGRGPQRRRPPPLHPLDKEPWRPGRWR